MSRLYGLIVEDQAIQRILEAILPRLVGADLTLEARLLRSRDDLVGRFHHFLLEFRYCFSWMHKVLVVCDSDRDEPNAVEDVITNRLSHDHRLQDLPFFVHVHAIQSEAETWLLCDEDALIKACGRRISLPSGNLEQLSHAKQKLQELLAKAKIPYTSQMAGRIAAALSLERLAYRCPRFAEFSFKAKNPNRIE